MTVPCTVLLCWWATRHSWLLEEMPASGGREELLSLAPRASRLDSATRVVTSGVFSGGWTF